MRKKQQRMYDFKGLETITSQRCSTGRPFTQALNTKKPYVHLCAFRVVLVHTYVHTMAPCSRHTQARPQSALRLHCTSGSWLK